MDGRPMTAEPGQSTDIAITKNLALQWYPLALFMRALSRGVLARHSLSSDGRSAERPMAGVSKDDPAGSAIRALWNVPFGRLRAGFRDAPSALLEARGPEGNVSGVTVLVEDRSSHGQARP